MSLIPSGFAKSAAAAGFYDHPIEQSLRLNDDDSAYLSWTPASAGNRKTWTWSGWVKRGNIGNTNYYKIFNGGSNYSGNQFTSISLTTYSPSGLYDSIVISSGVYASSTAFEFGFSDAFRDPSSWYHIVVAMDTTEASDTDRCKVWVNNRLLSGRVSFAGRSTSVSSNYETAINNSVIHNLGGLTAQYSTDYLDGYLAEVNFIDGTALDASSFGETKSGVWIPKAYSGSYGTNGFYLPFNHDYSVEGFSATTYLGNNQTSSQYIGGVGFQPDLVWIKERDGANSHALVDSVRGAEKGLSSNLTNAENTFNTVESFENDGFVIGTSAQVNDGSGYVAWCWDAGSGSPVSNTDGSITSTVKASTDYGFSIVSWTGNATTGATVGHGLSQQPDLVIIKNRDATTDWDVHVDADGDNTDNIRLQLNTTDDDFANARCGLSATTLTLQNSVRMNGSGNDMIAYCFHSVSGYSKFGSYTAASGDDVVTCGFKPALVMVKRTDSTGNWEMHDGVRYPTIYQDNGESQRLRANDSSAEAQFTNSPIVFTDTGFYLDSSVSGDSYADYDANGGTYIYMAFADKREAAFWLDQSGNNNDFENNNLTESDISLDSPTNNFATLNPLDWDRTANQPTFYEGNLKISASNGGAYSSIAIPNSGKWYFEMYAQSVNSSNNDAVALGASYGSDITSSYYWRAYRSTGVKDDGSSSTSYGGSWGTGDLIGTAWDADTGTLSFYKNGTSLGSAWTGLTPPDVNKFFVYPRSSVSTGVMIANFGQDSSFAGNKTAQGNTDANGYGDFYYAPPTGYLALCTANLEVPDAMNPALDASPQDYFNTVLYTGNGSTQSITGVGFQPDWTWIKARNTSSMGHILTDNVRGVGKAVFSNNTNAEDTNHAYGYLSVFGTDGFTVTAGSTNADRVNNSSYNYAAWNWKANGSGVSNTDGSITSTVSANTDAGFSIVSWASDGTDGKSVGHGLSEKPDMIIVKNRSYTDATQAWHVWHQALDSGSENGEGFLWLDNTNAETDYNYQYLASDSTLIYPQGNRRVRGNNGDNMIAYCFHSVEGFSKFGSYTGNGSTTSPPFVYCGFKPAFIMIKRTSGANAWHMADDARTTYNGSQHALWANESSAESTSSTQQIDFLSNGFRCTNSTYEMNGSGESYIFMAFAENPLKFSTAV